MVREGEVPQTKGELTRRTILEAAIARFGRDGYRATAVVDIARDAGVGGTVAYAYFPSKEALFLAAADEDAAAVIHEGLLSIVMRSDAQEWREALMPTLVAAVENHPLARRLMAGLEPEVSGRVLDIPALAELRKAVAERLRSDQLHGKVRADIDPVTVGNGLVTIMLSLLTSVILLGGPQAAEQYVNDVATVLEAALDPPRRRDETG